MAKIKRKMLLNDFWRIGEYESWFAEMAKDGWHLQKVGKLFAHFQQGEPLDTRYRIATSSNKNMSSEEKLEYKEAGWNHITRFGEFNVFASPVEGQASELYADPKEQAQSLRSNYKKMRLSVILISVLLLLAVIFYSMLWSNEQTPMLELVEGDAISQITLLFIQLTFIIVMIRSMVLIRKTQKKLLEGKEIDYHVPWRKSRTINLAIIILTAMITVPLASLIWIKALNQETVNLPMKHTELPLVALADIEQTPHLERDEQVDDQQFDWNNHYTKKTSFFAPQQYESREQGIVTEEEWEDGSGPYSPSIYIQAYKVRFPFMANHLMNDLFFYYDRRDYRDEQFTVLDRKGFDALTIREIDELKEIYAVKGKGVIYVRYFGHVDMERLLASLEERMTFIDQ
jgi:heme/copper-type cytochrome/quinol oxidase subunit 2